MTSNEDVEATTVRAARAGEIVVGLDEGAAAAAALRWAADQSRITGLPLHVVHAWQLNTLESAAIASGAGTNELLEAEAADARARATQWAIDALAGAPDTLRWQLDIVEGAPGPALVARSRTARLLVLGTQEHTGLRRAVLGSVSHYCLSHAVPPIVAVPAPDMPARSHPSADRDLLTTPGPLL